jgi:nucleotide-binding universal stress UspA family protein
MTHNDTLETFDGAPHSLRMVPAIVVGIDASPTSRAALRWAAEQSQLTGLPLRVVHAWHLKAHSPGIGGGEKYAEASRVDARARATRWVLDALGDDGTEVRWTLNLVEGAAGPALVARSRSARLLVLGTREHTGVRRAVHGSVSHYCLSHAIPPVVAVPDTEQAPARARAWDALTTAGPLL